MIKGLFVTLVAVCIPTLAAAESIKLVTTIYPPYVDVRPDGRPFGFTVTKLEALSETLGIDFELNILPWTRAQLSVKQGTHAGLVNCGVDQLNWHENFFLTQPLLFDHAALLALKGKHGQIRTLEDLADASRKVVIGVPRGYSIIDDLAGISQSEVFLVDDNTQGVFMLRYGRIDFLYSGRSVMEHTIDAMNHDVTDFDVFPLSKVGFGICFSKNNPRGDELRQRFDYALEIENAR